MGSEWCKKRKEKSLGGNPTRRKLLALTNLMHSRWDGQVLIQTIYFSAQIDTFNYQPGHAQMERNYARIMQKNTKNASCGNPFLKIAVKKAPEGIGSKLLGVQKWKDKNCKTVHCRKHKL
jgi:hypothetical protein